MKTGVCDVLVFPFSRAQLKGLTRYLLTAGERMYLKDQAKRIAVLMDTEKQQRALQAKASLECVSHRRDTGYASSGQSLPRMRVTLP